MLLLIALLACFTTHPPTGTGSEVYTGPGVPPDESGDSGDSDTGAEDTGDSGPADTADTADSGQAALDADGDGLPDEWEPDSYWADQPLSSLLLPTEVPSEAHWEVRIATSLDMVTWTPDERIIAYNHSSLDLVVLGDRLVIAGMGEYGTLMPDRESAGFAALSTTDLLTWGIRYFPIADANDLFLVDPALRLDADGSLRATWFAHSTAGVDPAEIEGVHVVQRGTWTGEMTQDDADPEYQVEGLADPVVCELGGAEWLFHTSHASGIRAAVSTDGGEQFDERPDLAIELETVPFCVEEGPGSLLLLAQGEGGRQLPSVRRLQADGTLGESSSLYAEHMWGTNCTSPVVGRFLDQWVMACAVRVSDR